jgi:hypothetical protein
MSLLGSAPASDLSKNVIVANELVARKKLTAPLIQANTIDTETLLVSGMAVEGELTVGGLPVEGGAVNNYPIEVGLSADFPIVFGGPNNAPPFDTVLAGDSSLFDPATFEFVAPEDGTYFFYVNYMLKWGTDPGVFASTNLFQFAPAIAVNGVSGVVPPAKLYDQAHLVRMDSYGLATAGSPLIQYPTIQATFDLVSGDRVGTGFQAAQSTVSGPPTVEPAVVVGQFVPLPGSPPNYATVFGMHRV